MSEGSVPANTPTTTSTPAPSTKTPTKSVTWRMPKTVAALNEGDWTPLRTVLDDWAQKQEPLENPKLPEETISVCLRVSKATLKALEREAKRMSKYTKRAVSPGMVARKIYAKYAQEE